MTQVSVNRPGTSAAAVNVENVSQRFSLRHEKTLKGMIVSALRGAPTSKTFLALENVNLEIASGTTVGLIGHNGSGKSTLLKIIGGVMPPTLGQVTRRGRLAALLELGAGFHKDLSGRENVFLNAEILGLSRSEIKRCFDEIVDFSGVEQFIDTPMKFYSSGMFVRLGFSVAIHTRPDVLLVDEVLAVGDEQFKAKCLEVVRGMQRDGKTIILVTHSMDQVMEFCDSATLLHHGQVRAQGAPAEVIAAFREIAGRDANRIGSRLSDARRSAGDGGVEHEVPRVREVRGRSASGGPLQDLRTGDTLEVQVGFSGAGDRAYVGRLEVFAGGTLVFATSTDRLGLDPFVEDARCVFRLPDLPLGGGRFRVAVSTATDRNGPALDSRANALQFSLPVLEQASGVVAMRASAHALDASAP